MSHISDLIVYFWLLPVVLQIILPLTMFAVWQVSKLFNLSFAKRETSANGVPALDQNTV
jgi:hypothetical protein